MAPRKKVRANNDNGPGSRLGAGGALLKSFAKYSRTGAAMQPSGGITGFVGHDLPKIGTRPANKPARGRTTTTKKKAKK